MHSIILPHIILPHIVLPRYVRRNEYFARTRTRFLVAHSSNRDPSTHVIRQKNFHTNQKSLHFFDGFELVLVLISYRSAKQLKQENIDDTNSDRRSIAGCR